MFILCSIVCFFTGLLAKLKERTWNNPATLLCWLYAICSFLSGLRLYGMINTSDLVYTIVLVGVASCFIGYLLSTRISVKCSKKTALNTRVLSLMIISSAVFSTIEVIDVIRLFRSGMTLDFIRLYYYGIKVQGNQISSLIKQFEVYVNLPLVYVFMPILSNVLVNKKNRENLSWIHRILMLYAIIVSQFASGGRMILMYFLVELAITVFLNKERSLVSFIKKYKKVFLTAGMLFVIVVVISGLRGDASGTTNILLTAYTYLTCAFPVFSNNLEFFSGNTTYGLAFISGFIRPIIVIMKSVFGFSPQVLDKVYEFAEYAQVNTTQIAQGRSANAFTTMFSYFYLDGRFLGVILESILYMIILSVIYKKYKKYRTDWYQILYILSIQGLCFSFVRYQYVVVSMCLPFVYAWLLFKKSSNVEKR